MRRYLLCLLALLPVGSTRAGILETQKLLDAQSWRDNRDDEWFKKNIPFFDCPDKDLVTTYYYRWEVLTKHLTYGSANTGYVFTEFIDRPFWSGTYGAISCPAGHQLYEARWLRHPRVARDYTRYWFRTPGAQPRRYSTWLADAALAVHLVHPNRKFLVDLLPDLVKNYEGWEKTHFVKSVGLFWQTGHDDGMEININSRQTRDTVRGAPGYRPTLNSYLWADALAIAAVADLKGDRKTARAFRDRAASLKKNMQAKLWDRKRQFFFPLSKQAETKDGHTVKALSLTYQSGKYAGSKYGREQIGFVPWQFRLPDANYESAWKVLMDKQSFLADFGPTTVERNDPLFLISKTCCVWSGNSWPYATTQTLKGFAHLLQTSSQKVVSRADYLKLLQIYAKTHRKKGKPYIAEACHPDTGSWEGHDAFNHSEHYFHSGYVDLILTGLVGLVPRDDDTLEVRPLAPTTWDWFAVDNLRYRGREVAIVWDRTGNRYSFGAGLHLIIDGKKHASGKNLDTLTVKMPPARKSNEGPTRSNMAVNNDTTYYPRVSTSLENPKYPPAKLIDGNYWYHVLPPNRFTFEGSKNATDWIVVDFGTKRTVDTLKLYLLDDDSGVVPPTKVLAEYHDGNSWKEIAIKTRTPAKPQGRRANVLRFAALQTSKIRLTFTHGAKGKTGLSEIEVWGAEKLPLTEAPLPAGNLAYNPGKKPFPRARASFTSRYDRVEMVNDGKINFLPQPHNRWTSYGSLSKSDWLEIDFGTKKKISRIELAIYDDRGGVQAPASYRVEVWADKKWVTPAEVKRRPARPAGGQWNEVRFKAVETTKVRLVFVHHDKARSGVSEVMIFEQ